MRDLYDDPDEAPLIERGKPERAASVARRLLVELAWRSGNRKAIVAVQGLEKKRR